MHGSEKPGQLGPRDTTMWPDAHKDQVAAVAQINDVLTGHPEDARYITRAQQDGLDPLHIRHRPSRTPKTQQDSSNATTSLTHAWPPLPTLIGPTVTPLFPYILVTHLVTSAVARSLLPRPPQRV